MNGVLIGERLSDDLSSTLLTIRIEKEDAMEVENWPVLGDEVEVTI